MQNQGKPDSWYQVNSIHRRAFANKMPLTYQELQISEHICTCYTRNPRNILEEVKTMMKTKRFTEDHTAWSMAQTHLSTALGASLGQVCLSNCRKTGSKHPNKGEFFEGWRTASRRDGHEGSQLKMPPALHDWRCDTRPARGADPRAEWSERW